MIGLVSIQGFKVISKKGKGGDFIWIFLFIVLRYLDVLRLIDIMHLGSGNQNMLSVLT